MTVKEIFNLRKQGKIEEAYEAIRPMYAAHKGRYTTLCMFWTASDVFKLRLEQGRTEEATKIYKALQRILPRVEEITKELDSKKAPEAPDPETNLPWENNKPQHQVNSAAAFLQYAAHRLASTVPPGSTTAVVPAASPAVPPASSVLSGSPACPVLSGSPAEGLNKGQQSVLDCIKAHPGLKVPGIETETGIPAKSIERHIKVLIERNLIEHRGSKKTGGYHALDSTFGRLLP